MNKPNLAAMNPAVANAIEQMMAEQGDKFSLEKINLAELERRTGISRAKLRRMKEHNFEDIAHALKGRRAETTLLSGYTGQSAAKRSSELSCVPGQAPGKRLRRRENHCERLHRRTPAPCSVYAP